MTTIELFASDAAPTDDGAGLAHDLGTAASAARVAAMWADGMLAPGRRVQQVRVAQDHAAAAVRRAQAAFTRVPGEAGGTDGEQVAARAISTLYAATESLRMCLFVPSSLTGPAAFPGRASGGLEVDAYAVESAVAYLRSAADDLEAVAHLAAFEAASLDDLLGGLLAIPV